MNIAVVGTGDIGTPLARADRARMPADRDAGTHLVYTPGIGVDMVNGARIYREVTK
ncbi:hypothetical protein OIE67_19620 [Nonomuraea fuscirosea]|jgi:hypothetical protein|uniref:hypothetical protein n=1 Tax=Nonomuraea fuscirosea TaxID=1291556 RepID=UPI002DDB8A8C|nr:hypothetical protein [Nonomuraea fuscirosea]WSA56738.1 hypothetical protein OIE67_19620 [Nonomuraea fuscirosea]